MSPSGGDLQTSIPADNRSLGSAARHEEAPTETDSAPGRSGRRRRSGFDQGPDESARRPSQGPAETDARPGFSFTVQRPENAPRREDARRDNGSKSGFSDRVYRPESGAVQNQGHRDAEDKHAWGQAAVHAAAGAEEKPSMPARKRRSGFDSGPDVREDHGNGSLAKPSDLHQRAGEALDRKSSRELRIAQVCWQCPAPHPLVVNARVVSDMELRYSTGPG